MTKAYVIYYEATAENYAVLLDADKATKLCDKMNAELPEGPDYDSGYAFYIDVVNFVK